MTPGLANEPPFPARAVQNAVAAVASLDRPTVPLFVGVCEINIASLGEVQGTKGHAVRGLHWEGDELWAWSSSSRPGQPAPEYLDGWEEGGEGGEDLNGRVANMTLEETEREEKLEKEPAALEEDSEEAPPIEEKEPTTKGQWLRHYLDVRCRLLLSCF